MSGGGRDYRKSRVPWVTYFSFSSGAYITIIVCSISRNNLRHIAPTNVSSIHSWHIERTVVILWNVDHSNQAEYNGSSLMAIHHLCQIFRPRSDLLQDPTSRESRKKPPERVSSKNPAPGELAACSAIFGSSSGPASKKWEAGVAQNYTRLPSRSATLEPFFLWLLAWPDESELSDKQTRARLSQP